MMGFMVPCLIFLGIGWEYGVELSIEDDWLLSFVWLRGFEHHLAKFSNFVLALIDCIGHGCVNLKMLMVN